MAMTPQASCSEVTLYTPFSVTPTPALCGMASLATPHCTCFMSTTVLRCSGRATRVRMAAASARMMLSLGLKVPKTSLPVRTPALYREKISWLYLVLLVTSGRVWTLLMEGSTEAGRAREKR